MVMITIDTYEAIQGLQHSGMPEVQAKAVVDTIQMVDLEHVATKADLKDLQINMQRWMLSMMLAQTGLLCGLMIALIKFL